MKKIKMAVSLTVLLAADVFSQTPINGYSDADISASKALRERIEHALSLGKESEWMGNYHYGDGLGSNARLVISEAEGFYYRNSGCVGLYELDYGSIRWVEGNVQLLGTQQRNDGPRRDILVPVRWGERHYLLWKDQLLDFVNAVNAGMEPCQEICFQFFLKDGEQERVPPGVPQLPAPYRDYLLSRPITAKVIAVVQAKTHRLGDGDAGMTERITRVVIDQGSRYGVRDWMTLYVDDGRASVWGIRAVIRSIKESSSEIDLIQDIADEDKASYTAPKVGWTVSTTPYKKAE